MSEVSGMYKIAVLGERESVMGFAALGLAVFPWNPPKRRRRPSTA